MGDCSVRMGTASAAYVWLPSGEALYGNILAEKAGQCRSEKTPWAKQLYVGRGLAIWRHWQMPSMALLPFFRCDTGGKRGRTCIRTVAVRYQSRVLLRGRKCS